MWAIGNQRRVGWDDRQKIGGCASLNKLLHSTYNLSFYKCLWRWQSWLRHCATNREVAGSISEGVFGIFHWLDHSGLAMALGSTQKWVSESFLGGKGSRCVGLTLSPSCAECQGILEALKSCSPQGLYRDTFSTNDCTGATILLTRAVQ
jgi:hypothetical protein